FDKTRPVQAAVDEKSGADRIYIVEGEAPVEPLQIIAGCRIIVNRLAERVPSASDAQVVSRSEEELVLAREIHVEAADRVVEAVPLTVGIGEEVGLSVRLAGLVGPRIILQVILYDGRNAVGRNEITGEWLPHDPASLDDTRERIVNLI